MSEQWQRRISAKPFFNGHRIVVFYGSAYGGDPGLFKNPLFTRIGGGLLPARVVLELSGFFPHPFVFSLDKNR
jgi:hypothetical protein